MRVLAVLLVVAGMTLAVPVRRGRPPPLLGAVVAIGLALALVAPQMQRVPIGVAILAVAGAGAVTVSAHHRRARRQEEERRDAVVAACESLTADLRAGLPPGTALAAAATDWPELRAAATAARLGADVVGALRDLSELPGAEPVRWVAAAWSVAHRSGAGLASAIDRAGRAVVAEREVHRVVAVELASVRATARLLAVLPLGVLLLGRGVGGDPVGFLLDSVPGACCLGAGLLLAALGAWWVEAIAAGVGRR
jgi:tight adherence protein B